MNYKKLPLHVAGLAAAFAFVASLAHGQNVTLVDGNSAATVNLGALGGGTGPLGMNSWTINNQNQLYQQWFWFRVGSDPTGQHSLDSLGTPTWFASGGNLDALYTGNGFTIEITYGLSGGSTSSSSASADITENISIQNTSANDLTFHFFQYSDFMLAGTHGGSTVKIYQNGGFFTQATVTKGDNTLSEIVDSITQDQPLADRAEADVTPATYNALNSGSVYDLNNVLDAGPDTFNDATWALQWDKTIAAGDSENILKDKYLSVVTTPEPSSIAILALGAGAFVLQRRRRSA